MNLSLSLLFESWFGKTENENEAENDCCCNLGLSSLCLCLMVVVLALWSNKRNLVTSLHNRITLTRRTFDEIDIIFNFILISFFCQCFACPKPGRESNNLPFRSARWQIADSEKHRCWTNHKHIENSNCVSWSFATQKKD